MHPNSTNSYMKCKRNQQKTPRSLRSARGCLAYVPFTGESISLCCVPFNPLFDARVLCKELLTKGKQREKCLFMATKYGFTTIYVCIVVCLPFHVPHKKLLSTVSPVDNERPITANYIFVVDKIFIDHRGY